MFSTLPFSDTPLADRRKCNNLQQWKSKMFIEWAALETLGESRCSSLYGDCYMEDFKSLYPSLKTDRDEPVL